MAKTKNLTKEKGKERTGETAVEEMDLEELVEFEEEPTDTDLEEEELSIEELEKDIDWESIPKSDCISFYMRQMRLYGVLTAEEEKELFTKMRAGDKDARETIANSNLRLVINIAKKSIGFGVDFEDLIQEGNVGLLTAIDRFDERKGFRFSTYATWWIKSTISEYFGDMRRGVRLPLHVRERMRFVGRAVTELQETLLRQPTVEEIENYIGWKFSKNLIIQTLELNKIGESVSLNANIKDDNKNTIGDLIADDSQDIVGDINREDRSAGIRKVLEKALPSLERRIIELKFGLDSGEEMTLEEVAETLKKEGVKKGVISKERVRQLFNRGLDNLKRNPKTLRMLKNYL